jgi:hypothetical protein
MKKQGRNDPCPCGSGRKYKKCHGASAPEGSGATAAALYSIRPAPRSLPSGTPRPCGDCSKCCDGWVKTRVLGHDIDLGHPCPFSSGHHCTIHPDRPDDPCRIFFCGWAEAGSALPEWMRPEECGVIVLAGRSSWAGHPVDVLVSAGCDPDERMLTWFREYSTRNMRPFLYQQNEQWFGYGPQAFQHEVAARAARNEPLFQ